MVPKLAGFYLLTGVSPQNPDSVKLPFGQRVGKRAEITILIKTPAATVAEGAAPRKNEQRTACPLTFLLRAASASSVHHHFWRQFVPNF